MEEQGKNWNKQDKVIKIKMKNIYQPHIVKQKITFTKLKCNTTPWSTVHKCSGSVLYIGKRIKNFNH